jgi:chromosome segregation ATPase
MRFLILIISLFMFSCGSNEAPKPVQPAVDPAKQKELELALEKQSLENKELLKAKDFLESQKKAAEELAEKFKNEAAQVQQKLEAEKAELLNKANKIKSDLEAEKAELLTKANKIKSDLEAEKVELTNKAQKMKTDLEEKIASFKPTDTSALTKELKEKNDTIKTLTDEKSKLKEEVKTLTDKLKAVNNIRNVDDLFK